MVERTWKVFFDQEFYVVESSKGKQGERQEVGGSRPGTHHAFFLRLRRAASQHLCLIAASLPLPHIGAG